MAKKQQSKLSYGPNLGLIGGARDVARSEAMIDSASGAFASGLTGGIVAGIQEKEKNNAIRDAYINDLKSIDNVYKLDQSYNKKAVNDFVLAKKDAYAAAADCFAKTKDQGCRETMEEIKFSFSNLNQQLELLMGDRKEYLDAYDKGQVVDLLEKGDGIYASAYTNKGQFQIEENGNIGFNVDGKYTKFNDIAGKWNVDNNIYKAAFLKLDSGIVRNASRGGKFDKIGVTNQMSTILSSQGVEEMQVALKANVVGDEKMIIGKNNKGEPIYAGNLSFESIWSKGQLASDFYKGYKPNADGTYDTKWMFENTNSNEAIRLKSMYDANVFEQRHEDNFVSQTPTNKTTATTTETGNFAHVNKGQFLTLAGVSVQKGSLENYRTAIESRRPGGFYLGPKGDEKAFVPVGKSGWEQRDGDGKVLATYNSVSELIKSGLKTSDKGFASLITMDIDGDGIADGPVRKGQGSTDIINMNFI